MSNQTAPAGVPQTATAGRAPQIGATSPIPRVASRWDLARKIGEVAALVLLFVILLITLDSARKLRLFGAATSQHAKTQAVIQPANPLVAAPPPSTQQQIDQAVSKATAPLTDEIGKLKDDIEKRDAEQSRTLDRLVTLVGGYSLLIGLTAYFSLKSAREEADKQIQLSANQLASHITFTTEQLKLVQAAAEKQGTRNEEEWEKFKNRIWSELPDMRAMQEGLRTLLFELERSIPIESDWNDEESYAALKEDQRQQILISEATIAALPTLISRDSPENRFSLASLYRSLARFYCARYKAGKGKSDTDSGRADAYVKRSLDLDRDHPGTYRLRGAIFLARHALSPDKKAIPVPDEVKKLLDDAELDLRRALDKDENDLGAYYNLALAITTQGRVLEGVNMIRKAIDRLEQFPVLQRRKYIGSIMLNQACDLFTLAKASKDPVEQARLRAELVTGLKKGLDLVSLFHDPLRLDHLWKSIEKEFAPADASKAAGDLAELTDDEKTAVLTHKPIGTLPDATQTASTPATGAQPTAVPPAAAPPPGTAPPP